MTRPEDPTAIPPDPPADETEPDDASRATDPEWDPLVVYEGDSISASLAQAALEDAGIETAVDDSETDVIAVGFLRSSEGLTRILVSRHDEEHAEEVLRRFEEEGGEGDATGDESEE